MDKKILSRVKEIVEPKYRKIENWEHGWMHIQHVVEYSKKLAEMEGKNSIICQIAAYCHDLGRIEEEEQNKKGIKPISHAELSVEPAKEVLNKVSISGEDFDKIIEAIKVHAGRKYVGENDVALILQDADRKDALGKFGLLRLLSWFLKFPIKEPKEGEDFLEIGNFWLKKVNVELKPKLIKGLKWVIELYEVLINTKSAREYLLEDYLFMKGILIEVESN